MHGIQDVINECWWLLILGCETPEGIESFLQVHNGHYLQRMFTTQLQ